MPESELPGADVHNMLSPEELRARGFADDEELLLPMPVDDSDSEPDGPECCSGDVAAVCGQSLHDGINGSLEAAQSLEYNASADCIEACAAVSATEHEDATSDTGQQRKIHIREDPDGELGMQVFPCSRVLLRWLTLDTRAPPISGSRILELGAGTGALAMGLVAARDGAAFVYATEGDCAILANLEHNVHSNGLQDRIQPLRWDWEESQRAPDCVDIAGLDFIVAADVVYVGTAENELAGALASLCSSIGRKGRSLEAFLLLADRPPGGQEFLPSAQQDFLAGTTAVERFLVACQRCALETEQLPLDSDFIREALRLASGCQNGRPDGELCLYRFRAQPGSKGEQ